MKSSEIVKVVSAHSDGAVIQCRPKVRITDEDENWRPCPNPIWNFEKWRYRVEPVSRSKWFVYYRYSKDGEIASSDYDTREEALEHCNGNYFVAGPVEFKCVNPAALPQQ